MAYRMSNIRWLSSAPCKQTSQALQFLLCEIYDWEWTQNLKSNENKGRQTQERVEQSVSERHMKQIDNKKRNKKREKRKNKIEAPTFREFMQKKRSKNAIDSESKISDWSAQLCISQR